MPLDYDFSEKLKGIVEKLKRRDPQRAEMLYKKVNQVINSDEFTIGHYKNLRYSFKEIKRVHIDKSFVLTFTYDKQRKFILFLDFDHHDEIYKK